MKSLTLRSTRGLLLTSLALACGRSDEIATGDGSDSSSSTATSGVMTTTGDPPTETTGTSDTPTGTGGVSGDTSTTEPDPTTGDPTTGEPETTGPAPFCGDGTMDPGEDCDDANDDDTDACLATCVAAACGDGQVQAGVEDCDDANDDDADSCTNACNNAACGDGILGPGELCDDGNQNDDDDCTNACTVASCGDGVVQMANGEECDDNNADDGDACLATCKAAICGDNVIHAGVEDCDDGNMDDLDTCNNDCEAAACDDGLQNADETDIDCGGDTCEPCGLGGACAGDDDCGQGTCLANVCAFAVSCKQLLELAPATPDGPATLDPDGDGPIAAFPAFCDMTHSGGGWTLVMKALAANFAYDDVLWENASLLNEADFDFASPGKKSKYAAFLSVGFGELRSSYPDDLANDFIHVLDAPVASATALFTGPGIQTGTTLVQYWNDSVPATAKHFGCTQYINSGLNQKKYLGVAFLPDGGLCDWNGGARFGQRVNANHGNTGNHAGQGWGAYSTIGGAPPVYYYDTNQLLWVR